MLKLWRKCKKFNIETFVDFMNKEITIEEKIVGKGHCQFYSPLQSPSTKDVKPKPKGPRSASADASNKPKKFESS